MLQSIIREWKDYPKIAIHKDFVKYVKDRRRYKEGRALLQSMVYATFMLISIPIISFVCVFIRLFRRS